MSIEWSPSLSTGVKWQDAQHKELFQRVNMLLDAMSVGKGKDEVKRLFAFLDEYFTTHFEAEEAVMKKFGFPGEAGHKNEHMNFRNDIARIRQECSDVVTTAVVIRTQRYVVNWLLNHIGKLDKVLGEFILMADKGQSGHIEH